MKSFIKTGDLLFGNQSRAKRGPDLSAAGSICFILALLVLAMALNLDGASRYATAGGGFLVLLVGVLMKSLAAIKRLRPPQFH